MAFPQASVGRFGNPVYSAQFLNGSGGTGGTITPGDYWLSGSGSPEGVKTGDFLGQSYLDVTTGEVYHFNGVLGANVGWV